MTELKQWLDDNRLDYSLAGDDCLIFTPPPAREDCHHSLVTTSDERGQKLAKRFRGYGWAVHISKPGSATRVADAVRWLQWLGYGRDEHGRPVLRLPRQGAREFGRSKIDLVRVVEAIVRDPSITSRALAIELTRLQGRRIDRQAVNRAMMTVGWGPEEREAFKGGAIGAPKIVRG